MAVQTQSFIERRRLFCDHNLLVHFYRFKYSCLYELDSLAVVNVRDLGGLKHAFKLLVFPDARLFQCADGADKQGWMEAFEGAKRQRQKELETVALKRSDTITHRER